MTEDLIRRNETLDTSDAGGRRRTLEGVPFEGLTLEQARWVKEAAERIGLPLDNVTSIRYRANLRGRESVLAQVHLQTGELTLFKALSRLPEIAQLGTLAHELAHENDPFDLKNIRLYGSAESWLAAQAHARVIAEQTASTRVFLNGYHRLLYQMLQTEEINQERFAQETHAILVELRFTNPNHLLQVQAAQAARLREAGRAKAFVALMTENPQDEPTGVDRTLIGLISGVENLEQLNVHIEKTRRSFSHEKSPLSAQE